VDKSDSTTPSKTLRSGTTAMVTPLNRHQRKSLKTIDKAATIPGDETRLNHLRESIEQLPDIDATRVVQLHHRITAGDYEIDSDRLAEKLLNLENQLSRD